MRLGTGLISTMAALVLGLLIASANTSFDTQSAQIKQMTANIILLDRLLTQYGSETNPARDLLRRSVVTLVDRVWRENVPGSAKEITFEESEASDQFLEKLVQLSPKDSPPLP